MSARPTALSSLARYALDAAREFGVSVPLLCEEAGVSEEALGNPDGRIPVQRLLKLWELAALHSGDPSYGLHVAERVASAQSVQVVGFAAKSAQTLGDAIATVGRFARVMNETTEFELARGPLVSSVRVGPAAPNPPWPRVYCEVVLGGYLRVARSIASSDLGCRGATFQHPSPPDRAEYERVFGDNLEFDARHNSISFLTSALDLPLLSADPELFSYFRIEAASMLARLPEASATRERVRDAVSSCLMESPSIGSIARRLGMSSRTLQRALKEEGVTFADVRDEVRREIAISLVRDRRFSLAEIGTLIGYADGSAFRAAFRRWTKQSPREARAAARDGSPTTLSHTNS